MTYATTTATQADITDLYGDDFLLWVADRDKNGTVDTAAVSKALAYTASMMARKLGKRFPLPLTLPSGHSLIQVQVDLTAEMLAGTDAGVLTDEHKARMKRAREDLEAICSGDQSLGLGDDEPDTNFEPEVYGDSRMMGVTDTEGLI